MAPPHGTHLALPVPEELESIGPLLGLATSLVIFLYAARGSRGAARA
jgi:hypothetical protein